MDFIEKINPKLREFFERKKDITMIGAMWAFYWRWLLAVMTAIAVFFLALAVIAIVFRLAL